MIGRHVGWTLAKVAMLGVYIALDREGYPRPLGWLLRKES
jgi:hypothetical protein